MTQQMNLEKAFALFSEESKRLSQSYHHLQSEFAKLNNTLNALVRHIDCGLMFVSREGIVTLFNPAAEKITAISQKEIVGKFYHLFFSDTFFGFSLEKALVHESHSAHTCVTIGSEREEKELEISLSALDEGLIIMMQDVTEIKKLKTTSLHNDKLKDLGIMAATLAHEIRNPLGGIEGFASLLALDLKENPKLKMMADNICRGVNHLNSLVTTILIYAKPLELHFAKVDLNQLIEEMLPFLSEKKKMFFEKHASTIYTLADKEHLKRAILNLLHNALDAAKHAVHLILKQENKSLHIIVEDDGDDLKDEHLEKIFTPFFTTKTKGTGLGLAETYKIMQAHDGKILVENKPKTRFTLILQAENEN